MDVAKRWGEFLSAGTSYLLTALLSDLETVWFFKTSSKFIVCRKLTSRTTLSGDLIGSEVGDSLKCGPKDRGWSSVVEHLPYLSVSQWEV
jgi:hypothetical protein